MKVGLFSIIRYVPDPFRKEFVNVGALVLFPDEGIVEYRIEYGKTKLGAIDRAFSPDTIGFFEDNLAYLLKQNALDEEELASNKFRLQPSVSTNPEKVKSLFHAFAGSQVQLSEFFVSEFDTATISDVEVSYFLSDIMNSYVLSKRRVTVAREKDQSFKDEIASFFAEKDLLKSKRHAEHLIEKNGVLPGLNWTFDFVFKNGLWNIMETLDLEDYPKGRGTNVIGESGKILAKFGAAKLESPKIGDVNPITVVRGMEEADDDALLQVGVLRANSHVYEIKRQADYRNLLDILHVNGISTALLSE
jgi:hypothetical protein